MGGPVRPDGVPSLVGRGPELARLDEVLDQVGRGVGRVVALSGPAGIGKSRLAGELLGHAAHRGFAGLRGTACAYQADLSFAPLVEALRPLVRGADRSLTDGLGDLGRLFDGLGAAEPPRLGDAGLERTRLFEAIAQLMQRAAERRPVAMLVEDLHWADASSVDALHYLGRAIEHVGCLLVLTYRPTEASAGVRSTFVSLRRGGRLVEVPLEPLPAADVAVVAAQVLGEPVPDALLELLVDRGGGVPLFVRELTAALRESGELFRSGGQWVLSRDAGALVPPSVAELFAERVSALPSGDRAVLAAISVAADAAMFDVLDRVCADEPDLPDRLNRLHAGGLVTEDLVDGEIVYRAIHPLMSEAVYRGLSGHARQRCHAAVAEAIGQAGPSGPDDVRRLAHHLGLAGSAADPGTALAALSAAAEQAVARKAGEEGVRHARAALSLARRTGRDDLVPGLLEQLAMAASYASLTETAVEAWWEAAATRSGNPDDEARCLVQLARVELEADLLGPARRDLERAVTVLGDRAADDLRVAIAQVGLVLHTRAGSASAVAGVVADLERLVARSADPRAAALARYARLELGAAYGVGTVAEAAVDDAIEAAEAVGDPALVASLQRISIGTAVGRGEHDVVSRRVQQSLQLVRAAGLPMLEVIPTAYCAIGQFQAGAWDSALALSDRALSLAHRVGMPRGIALALALRAMVLLHRGAVADARACVVEAESAYQNRRLGRLLAAIDARIALVEGDGAGALDRAPRAGPFALPVLCHQTRAEASLLAGDLDEVRRTAATLDDLGFPYAATAADRLRGLAAGVDGASLLAAATDGLEKLALPFDAAVCRLEMAEVVAEVDPRAAVAAATHSMAVFDGLLAAPSGDRARRLLRRLGTRPRPRPRPPGELSEREIEVALLVAQGMSSAAVAQQLFLSPRTVTTHLENIYRRLGISSRAELSAWVERRSPTT